MVSYSVKLKCNTARIQTDGQVALYLQVIINRVVQPIPLNLKWPECLVNNKEGKIYPRKRKDPDFNDYQLIIENELNKINEVFKLYRIQDRILTMDIFMKELKNIDRRRIFTNYMSSKIQERFEMKDITKRTQTNANGTVNRLEDFRKLIHFYDIDSKFLKNFASYLRKRGNEDGTIWTRIKDIKTYIDLAKQEGIAINPDYENFKNSSPAPAIIFLETEEIQNLVKLYNSGQLDNVRQQTLQAYLFSCFSSLRISDVQRIEWSWLKLNNELEFVPWKTRRFKRTINIPLSKIARGLIDRKIGKFFNLPSDQEINRSLKDIAVMCEITKNLTFHVARHTFATHFYRQTKDLAALQKILGHSKIMTTMIYVHINDQDKRSGIEKLDDAFLSNKGIARMIG